MKVCKLTKPEVEFILKNANFTKDEEKIFLMLSKNKSITEIASEICVSDRTVNRRILNIKNKIRRLE